MNNRAKFKEDQVFFTSDLHFNHANILMYTKRQAKDVEEMEDLITDNWNSVVSPNSAVFILGDFYFGKKNQQEEICRILDNLNGRKYLILGNHDYLDPKTYKVLGFGDAMDYLEIMVENQLIILNHYPMLTWNHVNHGSWMLYGHIHGNMGFLNEERKRLYQINEFIGTKTMDVGIDCHPYFRPFSYPEIKEIMKTL